VARSYTYSGRNLPKQFDLDLMAIGRASGQNPLALSRWTGNGGAQRRVAVSVVVLPAPPTHIRENVRNECRPALNHFPQSQW